MLLSTRIENEIKTHSEIEGFIRPYYQKYCLSNIPVSILTLFDVYLPQHPGLPAELVEEQCSGITKVVLLVIDSLGYYQFLNILKNNPELVFQNFIKAGYFCPLTSVFPSTTVATLTSLHTGLTPMEHGLLGHRLYLKEFGFVADMLKLTQASNPRNSLLDLGFEPPAFLGVPTIHKLLTDHGVLSFCLVNESYKDSGLSQMLHAEAKVIAHVSSSDMLIALRKVLESNATKRMYVFAYWDATDGIAHHYGPDTEEFAAEIRNFSYSLDTEFIQKLDRNIARETLLLITADHGQARVSESTRIEVKKHPFLENNLLLPPTGQPRAAYLYAKQGQLETVHSYLTEQFDGAFVVLDSMKALQEEFFGIGKLKFETPGRIGDLTVISRKDHFLSYPYTRPSSTKKVNLGHHGGLSPEEMLIPFIGIKLNYL